ncbi:hypothetical protein GCM10011297_24660 [Bacterioplanes sanyensis]|nr:hypothetical protein GCM10011297_24660 [Bacterioplanes sanyensis]
MYAIPQDRLSRTKSGPSSSKSIRNAPKDNITYADRTFLVRNLRYAEQFPARMHSIGSPHSARNRFAAL